MPGKASRELKIKIYTIDMYGTKAKKVWPFWRNWKE